MTGAEQSACKSIAVAQKGISLLGLIAFLTSPVVVLLSKSIAAFDNYLIAAFLSFSILIVFKAWHLHFDSLLWQKLACNDLQVEDLNSIISKLFNKNLQNKTLSNRIENCYKMIKRFLLLIGIYCCCFLILMALFLFK